MIKTRTINNRAFKDIQKIIKGGSVNKLIEAQQYTDAMFVFISSKTEAMKVIRKINKITRESEKKLRAIKMSADVKELYSDIFPFMSATKDKPLKQQLRLFRKKWGDKRVNAMKKHNDLRSPHEDLINTCDQIYCRINKDHDLGLPTEWEIGKRR